MSLGLVFMSENLSRLVFLSGFIFLDCIDGMFDLIFDSVEKIF